MSNKTEKNVMTDEEFLFFQNFLQGIKEGQFALTAIIFPLPANAQQYSFVTRERYVLI